MKLFGSPGICASAVKLALGLACDDGLASGVCS